MDGLDLVAVLCGTLVGISPCWPRVSGEHRKSQGGAAGLLWGGVEAAPGQEFVAGAV